MSQGQQQLETPKSSSCQEFKKNLHLSVCSTTEEAKDYQKLNIKTENKSPPLLNYNPFHLSPHVQNEEMNTCTSQFNHKSEGHKTKHPKRKSHKKPRRSYEYYQRYVVKIKNKDPATLSNNQRDLFKKYSRIIARIEKKRKATTVKNTNNLTASSLPLKEVELKAKHNGDKTVYMELKNVTINPFANIMKPLNNGTKEPVSAHERLFSSNNIQPNPSWRYIPTSNNKETQHPNDHKKEVLLQESSVLNYDNNMQLVNPFTEQALSNGNEIFTKYMETQQNISSKEKTLHQTNVYSSYIKEMQQISSPKNLALHQTNIFSSYIRQKPQINHSNELTLFHADAGSNYNSDTQLVNISKKHTLNQTNMFSNYNNYMQPISCSKEVTSLVNSNSCFNKEAEKPNNYKVEVLPQSDTAPCHDTNIPINNLKEQNLTPPNNLFCHDQNSMTPNIKRKFSDEKTLKPKRFKSSNSLCSPEELQIAIIDHNHPNGKISIENWLKIELLILKAILHEGAKGGVICNFDDSKWQNGVKIIGCGNEDTLNFLTHFIGGLGEIWPNAKLDVVPISWIRHLTKVMLWIPPPILNSSAILSLIELQNSQLSTKNWKILKSRLRDTGYGKEYVINVDRESLEILKQSGGAIKFGLGNLQIILPKNKDDKKLEIPKDET